MFCLFDNLCIHFQIVLNISNNIKHKMNKIKYWEQIYNFIRKSTGLRNVLPHIS